MKPESVTMEEFSGSSSRRTLTSMRRSPWTWVCETFDSQCHWRPANSTSPAVSSTDGISPETRISVMRLSAIHSAKLRSRSSSTLWTVSPMVLKTASMRMPRIASATTTSISVNPRDSGRRSAALDLGGAVDVAGQRDAGAGPAREREPVWRHFAAAPGDELRLPGVLILLAAKQDRPPLQRELESEVGWQLVRGERRIALDGLPSLFEGIEALELVAGSLEDDAVITAFELGLFL